MVGATITIKDSTGASVIKTSDALGAYSFDVSALTAPFVITAKLQVGDTLFTLTSMLADKPAKGSTSTANVTPLTNAMAALLAPNGNPEELSTPEVLKGAVTAAKLADVGKKIRDALAAILEQAGVDVAKFDPISTVFKADRKGADRVLELVRIELTGKGVSITNPFLTDNGNGSASIQIVAGSSAVVTPLQAPPAGTVLDELDHFASLLEACLVDAPAVRATSAACQAVPFAANYKSGGFDANVRYGKFKNSTELTGAKIGKPERLTTFTPNGGTQPVTFFRMSYKTAAGVGGVLTDIAQKTNPSGKTYAWEIVGNQRDYDSVIDARLDNITQLNPANTSESSKSQYRVSLNLFFNPTNTAGLNAQMVRVKGPGLPAAGVVMTRSNVCGSDGFMSIDNKIGALLNGTQPIFQTSGSTNGFRLAAELKSGGVPDWTVVGKSTSASDAAMSDSDLAAIPSYATYTWEVWTFGTGRTYRNLITSATTADFTYEQRISSRLPSAGSLKGLPWNSLAAGDFLNPAVLGAAQSSSTINWSATAEPVDFAGAFGQKNTAAVTGSSATFVRISADTSATGLSINDTSKTVSPATDSSSGVASLGSVQGVPAVTGIILPSPGCAIAQFPAFDAAVGTKDIYNNFYGTQRNQFIRSRTYNLSRKYVVNIWNNFID